MRRRRAASFPPLLGQPPLFSPPFHSCSSESHGKKRRESHRSWEPCKIAQPCFVPLRDAAPAPKLPFNLAKLNMLILF